MPGELENQTPAGCKCHVRPARSADEIEAFRRLTREYYAWLDINLDFQGIEAELKDLPGIYGPPGGEILLAYVDGTEDAVGAVALKPLPSADDGSGKCCEMKRLFVSSEARGQSAGEDV